MSVAGAATTYSEPPVHGRKSPSLAGRSQTRYSEPPPQPPTSPLMEYAGATPWAEESVDPSAAWLANLPEERPSPPSSAFATMAQMTNEEAFAVTPGVLVPMVLKPGLPRGAGAGSSAISAEVMARNTSRETAILKHQRAQWQQQMLHEQTLQQQPWRLQQPVDHVWTEALAARAYMSAPITLRGDAVELPQPGMPSFDAFSSSRASTAASGSSRGTGSARVMPRRQDGGRWPLAPPGASESPRMDRVLERMPAGAATSLAAGVAPPTAPVGQAVAAGAQYLGAAYIRALFPRPNASVPPSPRRRPQRNTISPPRTRPVQVQASSGQFPSSVFTSEITLDHFLGSFNRPGGSVLSLPMVSQAPVFDPRLARASSPPISSTYRGAQSARAGGPRSYGASPRNLPSRLAKPGQAKPAYRHTAEYALGPLLE